MNIEIKDIIFEAISKKCYIDKNDLYEGMTMEGDLFTDSLGFMAIIVEIEKMLSIRLSVEDIGLSVKCTVGELCEKIEAYSRGYDSKNIQYY